MSQILRKPQHWSGCAIGDIQERMDEFNNLPDEDRVKLLQGDWSNPDLDLKHCCERWRRQSNQ